MSPPVASGSELLVISQEKQFSRLAWEDEVL